MLACAGGGKRPCNPSTGDRGCIIWATNWILALNEPINKCFIRGDSPVKCVLCQYKEPELGSPSTDMKVRPGGACLVACVSNTSPGWAETGGPLELANSLSNPIRELQVQ